MRSFTVLPVFRQVTRTIVPKGRLRWAAVRAFASKASPLAVRRCSLGRYQEAVPVWEKSGFSSGFSAGAGGGGRDAVSGSAALLCSRAGAQAPAQSASAITAG